MSDSEKLDWDFPITASAKLFENEEQPPGAAFMSLSVGPLPRFMADELGRYLLAQSSAFLKARLNIGLDQKL